jgi:methionyl-tRNA synthetase
LANGLGNTVARIAKLAQKSELRFPIEEPKEILDPKIFEHMEDFRPDKTLQRIWRVLADLDKHINENEPWTITDKVKLEEVLKQEIAVIRKVAKYIEPFIPDTAQKIQKQFGTPNIKADKPLFPRL